MRLLVGDVYCIFVTFPCGILSQVWYLIVSSLTFASFLTLKVTHSLLNDSKCSDRRYAQISAHLKIPPYPTHSDYYSLAIKFNILSISKFYLYFCSVFIAGATIIYKRQILIK